MKLLSVVISNKNIVKLKANSWGYLALSWLRLVLLLLLELDYLKSLYISIKLYFLLKSPMPMNSLKALVILMLLAYINL